MKTLEEACAAWEHLSTTGSLSELRQRVDESRKPEAEVGPRSAIWKAFLVTSTLDYSRWQSILRDSRQTYTSLRSRFLSAIDNPNETDSLADPLSDGNNSPWDALRDDETLREEILLDVDRCMPENHYFREPETQSILLDILFVWAKLNPDIGYRQGMHEILAPIVWVVERDAIDSASIDATASKASNHDVVKDVFDAGYVAHDSFTVFVAVMRNLKSCYESSGQNASRTEEPAMITRSRRLIDRYLATVDPPLASHLQELEIAPQLFLMRWMRLLFGREFAFDDVLDLWDRLFVQEDPLANVDLVCVAMLLRIRWQLILADYNTALALLLRYPSLQAKHPPKTLAQDASYLQKHLNFDGGSHIILKYTGKSPSANGRSSTADASQAQSSNVRASSPSMARKAQTRPDRSSNNLESVLQNAAKGVLSQGEKWGVNKAVRDAVGEVRKNVPVLQNNPLLNARASDGMETAHATPSDRRRSASTLGRIEALQERNKSLAKMLEGALEQLWKQQNDAVAQKSPEDESVKNFTMAIAKVQLAQVYLDDPSLPLPSDEDQTQRATQSSLEHPKATATKKDGHSDNVPTTATANISGSEKGPVRNAKEIKPRQRDVQQNQLKPNVSDRPNLEHSSFSWMLGQDDKGTHKTQQVTSRPTAGRVRNESDTRRRNVGFLFGDAEEAQPPRRGSTAEKGKQKDHGTDDGETDDAFRLGTMK